MIESEPPRVALAGITCVPSTPPTPDLSDIPIEISDPYINKNSKPAVANESASTDT